MSAEKKHDYHLVDPINYPSNSKKKIQKSTHTNWKNIKFTRPNGTWFNPVDLQDELK